MFFLDNLNWIFSIPLSFRIFDCLKRPHSMKLRSLSLFYFFLLNVRIVWNWWHICLMTFCKLIILSGFSSHLNFHIWWWLLNIAYMVRMLHTLTQCIIRAHHHNIISLSFLSSFQRLDDLRNSICLMRKQIWWSWVLSLLLFH